MPHRRNLKAILCVAAALLAGSAAGMALADPASDVAALEAQCEQQREALIKPLRNAEIAKCKADAHNDPDHCEHFWASYGDAYRGANGTMAARMFDDLPICQQADRARKQLQNN